MAAQVYVAAARTVVEAVADPAALAARTAVETVVIPIAAADQTAVEAAVAAVAPTAQAAVEAAEPAEQQFFADAGLSVLLAAIHVQLPPAFAPVLLFFDSNR